MSEHTPTTHSTDQPAGTPGIVPAVDHGHAADDPHYGKYVKIWIILLFLTGVTIAASRMHFGKLNIWISLGIATTKASLVVLYFMHLKDEDTVFKYMFLSACAIMAIFIGLTLFDVAWR